MRGNGDVRTRRVGWSELQGGAADLLERAEGDFGPEALITLSGPAAVVAHLAMTELRHFYPIYTVMLERLERPFRWLPLIERTDETHKWRLYLPDSILQLRDRRVLVLDDCRISGETSDDLWRMLKEAGFSSEKVRFAVLATKRDHLEGPNPPDYYHSSRDQTTEWA